MLFPLKKTPKQLSEWRGRFAETLGVVYLQLMGYRILKRRYKTAFGEIDIVAIKGKTLVAIEVKSRPDYAQGLESILKNQKKRIMKALEFLLMKEHKYSHMQLRLDVICVYPFRIRHLKNAWNKNDVS